MRSRRKTSQGPYQVPDQSPDQSQTYEELAHENRRLRAILGAVGRAGLGVGALVEVYAGPGRAGIVVCRADRDEVQFCEDMREGLAALAALLGGNLSDAPARRLGVTAEPEEAGPPLPGEARAKLEALARSVVAKSQDRPSSRAWSWCEADVFEGTWLRWTWSRGPSSLVVRVPTEARADLFTREACDEALDALSVLTGRSAEELRAEVMGT